MTHLSLFLLGAFQVFVAGESVTAFEYDKVRALLAYLAVEFDRPHRRQKLAGLLWPDRPESNARQNLSQALFKLRRAIGDHQTTPPFLLITPQTLQMNPSSAYELDVAVFTGLVTACQTHSHYQLESCLPCMNRLQQAAALYRGDYLTGFSVADSPAFEEWIVFNRERLHRLGSEVLSHLSLYHQERGEYQIALQYAWRQVELDPWQEEAHRQLMLLLALAGQRSAALNQYETCRRQLVEELDVEPTVETRRLYEQIRAGQLNKIEDGLPHSSGMIEVSLSETEGRRFVDEFLETVPNRLSDTFHQTLYRQTGGHPLFTVELVRGMQERGDLIQDQKERWIEGPSLDWETLPARIEALIAERVGQLPEKLQELLTLASIEGEIFTAEVVARVQKLRAQEVVRCLSDKLERKYGLVNAREIRQQNGQQLSRYRFRNVLFQKYLYQRLDPAERVYLHRAVGMALEDLHQANIEEIAVQLGWHFQEAGLIGKAVGYLRQAGERAVRLSANKEAITHFRQGLALLETQPDSPERIRQELGLQIALSVPLMAVEGYDTPELSRIYTQAQELSQQVGETFRLFPALLFMHSYCVMQGQFLKAYGIARQFFDLAEQAEKPALVAVARHMLGISLVAFGKPVPARKHLEQAIYFWDSPQSTLVFGNRQDIGVTTLAWLCWALWLLGYPDQARQRSQETLTMAKELDQPLISVQSLEFAGVIFHYLRRDVQATRELAETCITLATEHGRPVWLAAATFFYNWALIARVPATSVENNVEGPGKIEAGLAQMHQNLADYQATGVKFASPLFLTALAEACGNAGQIEEGLALLTEALVAANQSGERIYEAEIYRLKGDLLLKADVERRRASSESPEDCFLQAVRIARAQQAKSLELRATMSLCHWWHRQGKREQAQQRLDEIYGWFSEGFDTPDLREAQKLLTTLQVS